MHRSESLALSRLIRLSVLAHKQLFLRMSNACPAFSVVKGRGLSFFERAVAVAG